MLYIRYVDSRGYTEAPQDSSSTFYVKLHHDNLLINTQKNYDVVAINRQIYASYV